MKQEKDDISFRDLFTPLTDRKAVVFIILAGCITFFNMLFNGFVWDDISFIIRNPEMYSINIPLFFGPNLFNGTNQYRALIILYFALMYRFFGTNPFPYHLLQLAIHIATGILVFYFLKKFFKRSLALFLALVFTVHPMQVESVSYIASTGCALFLTVAFPALFVVSRKTVTKLHWMAVALLFAISLLIKESGLLVVLVSIAYAAIFNRKHLRGITAAGAFSLAVYFFFRFIVGHTYFDAKVVVPMTRLSFGERLINIPSVIFYYFKTFVFPYHLAINRLWGYTSISVGNFVVPLLILAAVFVPLTVYVLRRVRKDPESGNVFLFFLIWTVVGFGMYSQLMPLDTTVADKWMYFPMIGLLGLIGAFVTYLPALVRSWRKVSAVFIIALLLLSARTIRRNADWHDGITLHSHDSQYNTNYIFENDFADYYLNAGDYRNALIHQKKSVQQFPYEDNILNLGRIYELSGDRGNARRSYERALSMHSALAGGHKHIIHSYTHLAKLYLLDRQPEKAVRVLESAYDDYWDYRPYMNDATLWYLSAIANYEAGNRSKAASAMEQTRRILPGDPLIEKLSGQIKNGETLDLHVYLAALLI